MSTTEPLAPPTAKGLATRNRIVSAAADLVHRYGVRGATNPAVRKAADVSGSQLSHYFPEKERLVRAVIGWRAEQVVNFSRLPPSGRLDSLTSLRRWADSYTRREGVWRGGCRFGALASEVLKSEPDLKPEIAAGFRQWREVFREGLVAMRERHELSQDADPDRLATVLLAAFQGGMLLAQAEDSAAPLSAALDGAIDYVAGFVTRGVG